MSEEQKPAEADKSAETSAKEKKDAEGQGMYHLYCPKCGHSWYSPSWDNYCPKWGCTGHAKRM